MTIFSCVRGFGAGRARNSSASPSRSLRAASRHRSPRTFTRRPATIRRTPFQEESGRCDRKIAATVWPAWSAVTVMIREDIADCSILLCAAGAVPFYVRGDSLALKWKPLPCGHYPVRRWIPSLTRWSGNRMSVYTEMAARGSERRPLPILRLHPCVDQRRVVSYSPRL